MNNWEHVYRTWKTYFPFEYFGGFIAGTVMTYFLSPTSLVCILTSIFVTVIIISIFTVGWYYPPKRDKEVKNDTRQ